jgi:prephenate dehydrogenase
MPQVTSVLEAILPACAKGSTVIEVCSLKANVLPFHEIALELGVELLSLHPMFSPTSGRPPGTTLLLNEPRFMGSEHFLSTAASQGETFLRWPLETHDKSMATIQAATYLSSLAFGEFLRTQNWNGKENSALHTQLFSQTLEILRRVSGPDWDVHSEILLLNSSSHEVADSLIDALSMLQSSLSSPERLKALIQEIKAYVEEIL